MGTCTQDLKRAVNEWLQSEDDFTLMVVDQEGDGIKVYESAHMAYTKVMDKGFFVMRLREIHDPLIIGLTHAISEKMKREERKNGEAN